MCSSSDVARRTDFARRGGWNPPYVFSIACEDLWPFPNGWRWARESGTVREMDFFAAWRG